MVIKILLSIFILGNLSAESKDLPINRILFSVDNRIVTLFELQSEIIIKEMIRTNGNITFSCQNNLESIQIDKNLIDQKLNEIVILKEINKLGLQDLVKKIELIEKHFKFKNRFQNQDDYEQFLKCFSLTSENIIEVIRNLVIIERYVNERILPNIKIYPIEIDLYYNNHKEEFGSIKKEDRDSKIKEILKKEKTKKSLDQYIKKLKKNYKIRVLYNFN